MEGSGGGGGSCVGGGGWSTIVRDATGRRSCSSSCLVVVYTAGQPETHARDVRRTHTHIHVAVPLFPTPSALSVTLSISPEGEFFDSLSLSLIPRSSTTSAQIHTRAHPRPPTRSSVHPQLKRAKTERHKIYKKKLRVLWVFLSFFGTCVCWYDVDRSNETCRRRHLHLVDVARGVSTSMRLRLQLRVRLNSYWSPLTNKQ